MEYEQFKQILKSELPLNRKERFYTGTVLPSILFHNGLSNFFRFITEIEGLSKDINQENTRENFLFYTEYNLKQAAGKKRAGVKILTATADTPDVVIEILEPQKALIVIEAKMFAKLTQKYLGKQMAAQKRAVIDVLKDKFGLSSAEVFHIALTPSQLGFKKTDNYQVINWEVLLDNPEFNLKGNYFANFLRFALENYDALVSDLWGKASTVRSLTSGIDVYKDGKGLKKLWVGRKGGKRTIEEDVKGDWRDRVYATNTENPPKGLKGNWITSEDFAAIVDRCDAHRGKRRR